MPGPRSLLALAIGKATHRGLVTLGRGATTLPGLVALTLGPSLTRDLAAKLTKGAVAVTGTNGKTTTARMLAAIVGAAGWKAVHNRSGSNLERGIASALLADAGLGGSPRADVGIFEVDEASVPAAAAALQPCILVVTNLFRDQLDRYHEVDALARRIGDAVARLPATTTLVLNADDPLVTNVADRHPGTVTFFGIDDPAVSAPETAVISDATRCPRCRAPLAYARVVLAHSGDWRCTSCGFARPRRDVSASRVVADRTTVAFEVDGQPIHVPLAGTYNVSNALAALAAARALGLPDDVARGALASFTPAFGRQETFVQDDRRVRLVLVKNPAGFDAAVGALRDLGARYVLAALNDGDADGRDVSWIWDADFERLAPSVEHAVVTGTRAADLALRWKYAGLSRERTRIVESWGEAFDAALAATPAGEELVVLATYTAMLSLHAELARRGHTSPFWED